MARNSQGYSTFDNSQPSNQDEDEPLGHTEMAGFTARKTVTGGALGIGLIASNIDQILALVVNPKEGAYKSLNGLEITKAVLLVTSLAVQVVTMILFVVLGAVGKTTRRRKKRHSRINNLAMILSFVSIVLNVAITSFNGHLVKEPDSV